MSLCDPVVKGTKGVFIVISWKEINEICGRSGRRGVEGTNDDGVRKLYLHRHGKGSGPNGRDYSCSRERQGMCCLGDLPSD